MSDPARDRWRLVLGRYAHRTLGPPEVPGEVSREVALDYLYGREYEGRGGRAGGGPGAGSLDPSRLTAVRWLGEVRRLFPKTTVERLERHALRRYGLAELVTDEQVLARMTPSLDLVKALLTFRTHLDGRVLAKAREMIRQVAEEMRARLEPEVRRKLSGRRNRFRRSPLKVAQNLEWRRTLRENLQNYVPERGKLVVERPFFSSRADRHLPWDLILVVDQSGSMLGSVIHSAVMAGILASLPTFRLRLLVFDTQVVDLSDQVSDPVEVLLSVQLGGGTDIGGALRHCEGMLESPRRTIVALLTDFGEGGSPRELVAAVRRLREAGVTLLGLAALDEVARACFDHGVAARCADAGMQVAALTPDAFADWLAEVVR